MNTRISPDEFFLKIASVVSERSTCLRHHVGAVAVRDKQILVTGYNGAPTGFKDCLELGCLRNELKIESGTRHEICRAIHAEENVIVQSGLHGVSLQGATIYCTHPPCILCTKNLINSKIARFVTYGAYSKDDYIEMFAKAGIEMVFLRRPSNIISYLD